MTILWTKSQNPVDWLIELVTGEDCAHMAILFEGRAGTGVVFESNLLGCHPAFYKTWMGKTRTVVHRKEIEVSPGIEDAIWDRWVERFDGHPYDFGGVIYLGWAKLAHRLFGTPLPKRNRWAKRRAFFCDEIYQLLTDVKGVPLLEYRANGMATPHDVWLVVQAAGI